MLFAPPAAAALPGLTPFVGSWHAHEEGLDIQPNGNGRETYSEVVAADRYHGQKSILLTMTGKESLISAVPKLCSLRPM